MELSNSFTFSIILITLFLLNIESISSSAGEPLFLSPLIKQGKISQAQKLAEVSLPVHEDVLISEKEFPKSYSGFLTVNEEFGTNLFFWYFPAKNNSDTAPVLFWSDGGPGATLLHSFFNLHGPLKFNQDRKLVRRNDNASLFSEFNVIYLDNPAGVGFSFTGNEAGYPKSGKDTAPNIYQFLLQFFQLFPNLKKNDFYNGGASYGGTYATLIAHEIHTQNEKLAQDADERINLKGIMLDSPWIHPIDQVDYGTWLYNSGLISRKSKEHFDEKRDEIIAFLKQGKYLEAGKAWVSVAIMDIASHTGLPSFYDYVDQDAENVALLNHNYTELVTSSAFRSSLHVGNDQEFFMFSPQTQGRMIGNFMRSVKEELEELLDTGKYRVLMIAGEFDLITGSTGIQEVALNLLWSGGDNFRSQDKQVWMDQSRYAGNIQSSKDGLLTYVLVRNAGHGVGINQPVKAVELMKGFVRGEIGGAGDDDHEFPDLTYPVDGDDQNAANSLREDL